MQFAVFREPRFPKPGISKYYEIVPLVKLKIDSKKEIK
jgi:hypothetical protein